MSAAREEVCRATLATFGRTWLAHGFANLPRLLTLPSIAGLRVTGPAVIVGLGPSLDKNGHLLREAKGKALIVAPAHALRALARLEVVPDILVALDVQDVVRSHCDHPVLDEMPLVLLGATVHPALYELPCRQVAWFSGNRGFDDWICAALGEPHAGIEGGGNACAAAYSILRRADCQDIALVGMDLAYPDGRYYAHLLADAPACPPSHDDVMLPGYEGGMVRSCGVFATFVEWWAGVVAVEGEVVRNCTEGGARLGGMVQRSLAEWLATDHGPSAWLTTDQQPGASWVLEWARDDTARSASLARYMSEARTALLASEPLAREAARLAAEQAADALVAQDALLVALGPALPLVTLLTSEVAAGLHYGGGPVHVAKAHYFAVVARACGQLAGALLDTELAIASD